MVYMCQVHRETQYEYMNPRLILPIKCQCNNSKKTNLCSSPDHCRTTNINILNSILKLNSSSWSNCIIEGIQVHHNNIKSTCKGTVLVRQPYKQIKTKQHYAQKRKKKDNEIAGIVKAKVKGFTSELTNSMFIEVFHVMFLVSSSKNAPMYVRV